jgi:copper resistance protein C
MRITSSFIVAVPVLLATAGAAFAHAYLRSAQPPVEGTTVQPPHEVTIAFTEAVEPRFSTIVVTNAAAQRVDVGQPHIVGGHAERLTVGLQALPSGIYTVVWRPRSTRTRPTAAFMSQLPLPMRQASAPSMSGPARPLAPRRPPPFISP